MSWPFNLFCEVFVRYPDLVVTTVANGSPFLGYIGEPQTWCGFIDGWATKMLLRPDPAATELVLAQPDQQLVAATFMGCVGIKR